MKKLTLLLIMLMPIMAFSQGYTGDYFKARNYVQAPMFRTTTDTVYRLGGIKADSIYIKGEGVWYKTLASSWTKSGSDIYYNTGNVFIGKTSGTYNLDVNGLIGGSNLETNTTSLSTRLGIESGLNENESTARLNVFIGNKSGYTLTTGTNNVLVGSQSGYLMTDGGSNVMVGRQSGYSIVSGTQNTFMGYQSGLNNTGSNNTYIGNSSGVTGLGSNNVFLGNFSGYYETGSNKFFIDNQPRTDEATSRMSSLMYGTFDATPANQTLTFNAKTNLHVHTGLFGRREAYNTTVADTWQTIKMDSSCIDRTTSGFVFNADSTGVIVKFNGYLQFSGHAKLLNNAASQQTATTFFRMRKNSVEQSQFNTAVGRVYPANGAHDLVSATGIIPISVNDTISVQLRTSNTNIDLEQIDSGIFTNQSSFCIFLIQIKSLKEFE